jgi:hypothetical protein
MLGMRRATGRLFGRSGAGGMKAVGAAGSPADEVPANDSLNSDGLGWSGRMVTSSTEALGAT